MEREAGSFIDDGKGNLTPNLKDEAMAKRADKKNQIESEVINNVKNQGARISKN